MQTTKPDQPSSHQDPIWILLAEYPLSDFLRSISRRDELSPGSLFQVIRDLGLSQESLIKMERMLAEFARESSAYVHLEKVEQPVMIRLFCQDHILVAGKSANPGSKTVEPVRRFQPSDPEIAAAWGYFLIERGKRTLAGSSKNSQNCVDLFIYREGE